MKIIVDRLTQSPVSEVFEASANWWRERTALDSGESTHLDCEILTPFQFSLRSYLIGADGKIEIAYADVAAREHVEQVIADV